MATTNTQVANDFAAGRLAKGSHLYTEHVHTALDSLRPDRRVTVLISYATPIAFLLDNIAYFDTRRYSVSTSKHQSYARRAVPEKMRCELSHDEFRRQCRELGIYLGGAR